MEAFEKLKYGLAGVPLEDYESELDRLWEELQDPDSDLSKEATERGLGVERLRPLKRQEAIALKTDRAGFDSDTLTLIVALAPVATEVVKASASIIKDLWIQVLLPRIRQSKGADVLPPIEDKP